MRQSFSPMIRTSICHLFRVLVGPLALCAIVAPAVAQTTYKCGNAYSTTPCADGKAVAAQDLRTEEQKRQADDTTSRQKAAASKFEKDRIAQERRDAVALKEAGREIVVGKSTEAVVVKRAKLKVNKPAKPPKPITPAKPAKKKTADKPPTKP